MGDYFHGWRRKLGVLTLLMACVFMGGWVRSRSCVDLIYITTRLTLVSGHGAFQVIESTFSKSIATGNDFEIAVYLDQHFGKPNKPFAMFRFMCPKSQIYVSSGGDSTHLSMVPYWSIVIPLTLFSAYLLISKPRPKNAPAESS